MIDWRAVRAGGTVALVVAVPFSFAARWIADNDSKSGAATWLSLLALIGFVFGAAIGAWVQTRDLPLAHGIVTAVVTYALAQAVFVIVRLLLGREVHWFAVFFNFTAVAFAGLIGRRGGIELGQSGVVDGEQ